VCNITTHAKQLRRFRPNQNVHDNSSSLAMATHSNRQAFHPRHRLSHRCLREMICPMSLRNYLSNVHRVIMTSTYTYTCWPTWLTSASTVTWLQLAKAQKLAYPTYCKPKKKTQLKATLLWIYPKHSDRTNVNQKSIQQIRREHDTTKLYFSRTKKISPNPCEAHNH
jgi:hypothetical protein